MSVFSASLLKEWRAHRRSLALLAALVAFLAVVFAVVFAVVIAFDPSFAVDREQLGLYLVIVSEAVLLVAVVPGLLTSERGNGLARRLPRGLGPVFAAKVCFLVFGLVAAVAFALLCGEAYQALLPADSLVLPGCFSWAWVGATAVGVLVVGFWILMVSTWVKAPFLALPGAAILLAALAAPIVWIHRTYSLRPTPTDLVIAAIFVIVAPLLAAGLSYVRGQRREDARCAPAVLGIVTLCVFLLPGGGWAALRIHRWTHPSPADPDVAIMSAHVAPGGRVLYLTSWRPDERRTAGGGVPFVHRVDLESGSVVRIGGLGSHITNVGAIAGADWACGSVGEHASIVHHVGDGRLEILDAATGAVVGETRRRAPLPAGLEARFRETKLAVTPWRTPDGRRLYVHERALWCEGVDEALQTVPPQARWVVASWVPSPWPAAFGLADDCLSLLDLEGRAFHDALPGKREGAWRCLKALPGVAVSVVRPGLWLARPLSHADSRGTDGRPWLLLDPKTGTCTAAKGLTVNDQILAVLDDGALLVVRRPGQAIVIDPLDWVDSLRRIPPVRSGVFLVDPESGSQLEVVVQGRETASVRGFQVPGHSPVPVRTPSGSRIFHVLLEGDDGPESVFARLDLAEGRLVPTVGFDAPGSGLRSWVIAVPNEDQILVVAEGRSIDRLRFGSSTRERLFPRGTE